MKKQRFFERLVGTCARLFMIVVITLGMLSPAVAGILDDFSTKDWSKWSTVNPSGLNDAARFSVVEKFKPLLGAPDFTPPGGSKYFGAIMTGSYDTSQISYKVLPFEVTEQSIFSVWLGFAGGDYMPFDDQMWAWIENVGEQTQQKIFSIGISDVGDFGTQGWQEVSALLEAGKYLFGFQVQNNLDGIFNSMGFVGLPQLVATGYEPSPVSSPGTLTLFGLSLLAFGFTRRVRS